MRVFLSLSPASASSCPLNASGKYVAKRITIDDERYVSISLIPHRYVIFVITSVATAGGAIAFGQSTWRLSGALRARHKGPGYIALLCKMYFFHVLSCAEISC